jgi:hypothetical protein
MCHCHIQAGLKTSSLASGARNKQIKITAVDSVESHIVNVEKRQKAKNKRKKKCKNSVF